MSCWVQIREFPFALPPPSPPHPQIIKDVQCDLDEINENIIIKKSNRTEDILGLGI